MELTREDLSWIYNVWVGNTFLIFGGIAAPPRNYSEQGLEERLISVKNYQSRWYLNNTLSGLDGLAATAGFLLLASICPIYTHSGEGFCSMRQVGARHTDVIFSSWQTRLFVIRVQ